jgi:hypothetical protein
MCERNLPSQDRVVACHVRLRVVGAVLVLDVHPEAELLQIEAIPVDPDFVAHPLRFGARRSPRLCHWQPPAFVPRAATLAVSLDSIRSAEGARGVHELLAYTHTNSACAG